VVRHRPTDPVRTDPTPPDDDPLRALVRDLAAALSVRCALVTRLDGPARVRTAAFALDGALAGDFAYDLAGAPCERVFADGELSVPDGVQRRFPADRDLARLDLVSYLGVLLRDRDGAPLGHLAVLDARPLDPERERQARALLTTLAPRAVAILAARRGPAT
jgi:hypothetical protein